MISLGVKLILILLLIDDCLHYQRSYRSLHYDEVHILCISTFALCSISQGCWRGISSTTSVVYRPFRARRLSISMVAKSVPYHKAGPLYKFFSSIHLESLSRNVRTSTDVKRSAKIIQGPIGEWRYFIRKIYASATSAGLATCFTRSLFAASLSMCVRASFGIMFHIFRDLVWVA